MTKKEFILRAMLQMATNPKYVETQKDDDENGDIVTYPAILDEIIFIDAEALANEAEKQMNKPFDDDTYEKYESLKTTVQEIAKYLAGPMTVEINE